MDYAKDYSGYGNEILYRMCREQPKHDDADIVASKLWIIGRSYSAAIERKAKHGFTYEKAARHMQEESALIDNLITSLNRIERITEDNIEILLKAHKEFTDILQSITGLDKRSLASKYLHFHAPKSVFIYDSIANKNIREKYPSQHFHITKKFDNQYERFVRRCIKYRDETFEKEINALATPRKIDARLLGYEANYLHKNNP